MTSVIDGGMRAAVATVWVNTFKPLSIASQFGGLCASRLAREQGAVGPASLSATQEHLSRAKRVPVAWPPVPARS